MQFLCSSLMFLARLCLATIFILAGVSKFINFDQTAAYMASKGLPMIPLFLFGAAIVEILGGLSLVFGYKARWGALVLLLFLIPTTLIFHDFWNLSGVEAAVEQINFLKNLAIMGGLLYVIAVGPGKWACASCCKHKQRVDNTPVVEERPLNKPFQDKSLHDKSFHDK